MAGIITNRTIWEKYMDYLKRERTPRIALSPTHSLLVVCRRVGISCYNIYTGEEIWSTKHKRNASIASFTGDGKYVVVIVVHRGVYIVDVNTGQKVVYSDINVDERYVNFGMNHKLYLSRKIIIQVRSNRVFYCDLDNLDLYGENVKCKEMFGIYENCSYDNTDDHIVINTPGMLENGGTLMYCLELENGNISNNIKWFKGIVAVLDFIVIPKDRVLIITKFEIMCKHISGSKLWSTPFFDIKNPGEREWYELKQWCLSIDKSILAISFRSIYLKKGLLEGYDINTGERLWSFPQDHHRINYLSISPDNTKIATSSGIATNSRIYDIETGRIIRHSRARRTIYAQNGNRIIANEVSFYMHMDFTQWTPDDHHRYHRNIKDIVLTLMLLNYTPSCCLYLLPNEILFDIFSTVVNEIMKRYIF